MKRAFDVSFKRKALPPEARITREYVVGFTPGEARGRAEEMLSLSGVSKG